MAGQKQKLLDQPLAKRFRADCSEYAREHQMEKLPPKPPTQATTAGRDRASKPIERVKKDPTCNNLEESKPCGNRFVKGFCV